MTEDFSDLAAYHTLGDDGVPAIAVELLGEDDPELVWRNELGGLTFRSVDRYLKWNPRSTGIDLALEAKRLDWLAPRHPAPTVMAYDADGEAEWLLTEALPGGHAVGDEWRARRPEAIAAIAAGLRALHAVPIEDFPSEWIPESWARRRPTSLGERPPIDGPVLVHGDACAPNTLVDDTGAWTGHVDLGDLTVGDRWADLAIASMSLDWNFGEGHQDEFFAAYGVERDEDRIAYYRGLWELEA